MEHGPVDMIVLASGEPLFDGRVLAELKNQVEAGTIRVLDAMVLAKNEEGVGFGVDLEDMADEQKEALGFIETGTRGLFDAEDESILLEGMIPGSALVALAIEHVWAISLVEAIEAEGMELALNWRIPAPVVEEAYANIG